MIDEDGYFLPGVDHEYDNLGPWELATHLQKLASRFTPERVEDHDGEYPGGMAALVAISSCQGCGRTLISAVQHDRTKNLGYCGRCKPFSSDGNVDHAEWLRLRRGAAR